MHLQASKQSNPSVGVKSFTVSGFIRASFTSSIYSPLSSSTFSTFHAIIIIGINKLVKFDFLIDKQKKEGYNVEKRRRDSL